MEKVGFIGACDKSSLIVNVAKLIEIMGKRVIVVDTSLMQKMKYIVPAINPTKSYITDFENVDYAVGFESINDICEYLRTEEEKLPYDYMLIDIDDCRAIDNFGIENTSKNYFVTSFDIYSLRKGVEILKNMSQQLNLSKILCDYNIRKEDEDYLNSLSLESKAIWNELSLYIPISGIDKQAIEENQRVFKVRLKRVSAEYLESLLYILQDIDKDANTGKIRRMIRE